CRSVRPACVKVTPWRPRTSRGAPTASSMLRIRVLAAAKARCARSAPWVILPASTTSRNRLRSTRSKRTVLALSLPSFLAKLSYAKYLLWSSFGHLPFVLDEERSRPRTFAGGVDCASSQNDSGFGHNRMWGGCHG